MQRSKARGRGKYVKKIIKQYLVVIAFLGLFTHSASAAGMVGPAAITKMKFMNEGLVFYGYFGNINGCDASNSVVLLKTDSNYDKAYALILSAYMGGKKITGYSDLCIAVDGTTYNSIRGYKYLTVE
ncbi:MAG: hypothetical protein COA47_14815 [Robiginitomaculum sp.]|nr:MAG: hypothetical protein COA47_14815 [Robiginitomaculum sp.]